MLAGGVGAIVGATTRSEKSFIDNLYLRIILSDTQNPSVIINLINKRMSKNDNFSKLAYSFGENVLATMQSTIFNENKKIKIENTLPEYNASNITYLIKELNGLKQEGLITEDEFLEKRKQLLSRL